MVKMYVCIDTFKDVPAKNLAISYILEARALKMRENLIFTLSSINNK
jgi:hypothetical protein